MERDLEWIRDFLRIANKKILGPEDLRAILYTLCCAVSDSSYGYFSADDSISTARALYIAGKKMISPPDVRVTKLMSCV